MESRGPTSAPSNQKKRNPHALGLPTSDIEIVNTDINSQN